MCCTRPLMWLDCAASVPLLVNPSLRFRAVLIPTPVPGLSTLPLAAISSVLTALDADPEDLEKAAPAAHDKAGYESVSSDA